MQLEPVHFSDLKHIARSPAHYLAHMSSKPCSFDSSAMRIGRVVHEIVLGGGRCKYVEFEGTRRGKAWEAFKAEHVDFDILSPSEMHRAEQAAAAVMREALAMEALQGVREQSIDWSYVGRAINSTPDAFSIGCVADLKTCASAAPGEFERKAVKMGYHAQLSFYAEAIASSGLGVRPWNHYLVAVETVRPYQVVTYRLSPALIEQGRRLWTSWMETLLNCERSGEWPGYSQAIVDMDVAGDDLGLDFGDTPEQEQTEDAQF